MAIPILKTKFYIPPVRSQLVERPRLIEKINAGLDRKLTLVSAPAGFGKTTLLSNWIASCERPIAWISLDKGDNMPAQYLAYCISALQTVQADMGEAALMQLHSSQPPPIETLMTGLINDIAEITVPCALVLDDYHVITEPQVHDAVIFLLENLPPQMHMIVATRADPPWPLARLRARREITEVRADDLRFSAVEAAAFLNDVMGLGLSPEDIAALDSRTEGWIAGLQLAALSMRGKEDVSAFIRAFSGSHHYILDYLMEEVLGQQSSDVRDFLLSTCILDRFTAPLCDAVTGRYASQTILATLEQANLFIVPLDDERRWYRYHHLFADLLRGLLSQTFADRVPTLHRRASEWFEEEGSIEETISHAFEAKDDERVARLVEKYAEDLLHQSNYNTLLSWIEALPDSLVRARPWLCVYRSWTRHWSGTREGGEECLDDAEQALDSLPSFRESEGASEELSLPTQERRLISGYIATVRAHYALTNEEIPRAIEQAQKALRLLPEDRYFTRGTAAIALGGAYWGIGDISSAEQAFAECATNALKGGYPLRASSALCYVGMQRTKQAKLLRAQEAFREALALSQGPGGKYFPNAGYPLVKLGELDCEWNDLEQAYRSVDQGVNYCIQLGHVDLLAEAYVARTRVQLARRDFAGAEDTLQRTDQLLRETKVDPWTVCWLDDCRLRLWLSTGRLEEAIRWAEMSGLRVDDQFNYHHDLEHTNLARVLVAQGMRQPLGALLDEALHLLDRLFAAAEAAGWIHEEIKILVLQSLARQARGDREGALRALAQALALAESDGYVRIFINEGAPMGELLRQAAARDISLHYVNRLLAALEPEMADDPPVTQSASAALIEPLSDREIEVLRLLTSHLSTPEIAQQLYVSVNTVRSHVKSIYDKLAVHSRQAAVVRARELNLLDH